MLNCALFVITIRATAKRLNFISALQIHWMFLLPIRKLFSVWVCEWVELLNRNRNQKWTTIRSKRKDVIRMWKLDGNYWVFFLISLSLSPSDGVYLRARLRSNQVLLHFCVSSTFISLSKLFISVSAPCVYALLSGLIYSPSTYGCTTPP